MKTIKLKYVDFWPGFNYEMDLLYQILQNTKEFEIELCDSPDYVVYSTFGKEHLRYDGVLIYYAGEEQSPDFNVCDYGIGFDYMEFGDRYFRLPLMYQPLYRDDYIKMIHRNSTISSEKKFCSFVYSNPEADSYRELFFEELSRYKHVDSGGKYRNNIGGPVNNKIEFESQHKFSIAFENVTHPGYHTEKIMQSFAAGTIPIYWGDPLINNVFNNKAFINAMDYTSVDSVIERVKYLDTNEEAYRTVLNEFPLRQEWMLEIVEERFRDFIINIFSQDLMLAKRTTRKFWNKRYVDMLRKQEKLYQSVAPIRKIRYRIIKSIHRK